VVALEDLLVWNSNDDLAADFIGFTLRKSGLWITPDIACVWVNFYGNVDIFKEFAKQDSVTTDGCCEVVAAADVGETEDSFGGVEEFHDLHDAKTVTEFEPNIWAKTVAKHGFHIVFTIEW